MRIPLVGSLNSRDATNTALFGSSQKDQYFLNCAFQVVQNEVSGKQKEYVMGRQEFSDSPIPSGGSGAGTAIKLWSGNSNYVVTAVGNTNSTIFVEDNSVGTITGQAKFIDESFLEGVAVVLITSTDNTGWYYPADAGTGSPTFTGDLNSSTAITNVAVTTGIYTGQLVTHANIPADTRITSILGSTVNISAAATATAAGQTITRTPIAKITDPDYPGNASLTTTGRLVALDGYTFIATTNGRVYQSDLNDADSFQSGNYITAQEFPDPLIGLMRVKNYILAFGTISTEVMNNNGNASGSVLGRLPHLASNIGCISQYGMCYFGDTVAFVGRSNGLNAVYLMNGATPVKISNDTIDAYLNTTDISTARLHVLSSWGNPVLALTTAASTRNCQVWLPNTKLWHPWILDDAISQSDVRKNPSLLASAFYVGGSNSTYISNSPAPASGTVQFVVDFGSTDKLVPLNRFAIVGDRAVSALNLTVSFSRDDGQNFSSGRTIDVSAERQQLSKCGSFRGRMTCKITGLSGVSSRPHRLEAVDLA